MRTWWRFLQKHDVGTKFDIYVFSLKTITLLEVLKALQPISNVDSVNIPLLYMILLIILYSQFVSINVCLKLFYAAKYTNQCLDIIMYLFHC